MTNDPTRTEDPASDEGSLYDQLGGREAVEAVVDRFYERVLGDDRLAPYFEDTDMETLRRHQARFIAEAVGGPSEYEGRSMREAHSGLGITAEDFQAVAGHLRTTLLELDVPEEQADVVMARVAALESEVVQS